MLRDKAEAIVKRFKTDQSGAVIMLAAMVIPVLAFVVGIGIDYGRASKSKTVIASALDAALLKAGRDMSAGAISASDVQDQVTATFNAMVAESSMSGTAIDSVAVTVDKTKGLISGTVKGESTAAFAGILGIDSLDVGVNGAVNYNTLTVELAMMLDVTGSMGGQKINDLKSAATNVIDILLPADGSTTNKVRIGLVPYSNSVNVGSHALAVTGNKNKECVVERAGVGAYDDAPPSEAMFNTTSSCPSVTIEPLSTNTTKLKNNINSYKASGMTAGHLGTAWAWYMLSPRWNAIWPAASKPAAYGTKDLIKVMILMTDGSFNQWYVNGNGNSGKQAKDVCAEAKKKNVIIYSVAFKAPSSAQNLLKTCATSADKHYFNTTTGDSLKNAFEAIAIEIRNLRLSS